MMKKIIVLVALFAVFAIGSAQALTLTEWASGSEVVGDMTFTLNSYTLPDAAQVSFINGGSYYLVSISDLGFKQYSGKYLDYSITANQPNITFTQAQTTSSFAGNFTTTIYNTDPDIVFGGSLASPVTAIPGSLSALSVRSELGASTLGWQNLQTMLWVEVQEVPEPSSIIVLLSGGLGSFFAFRRRKA